MKYRFGVYQLRSECGLKTTTHCVRCDEAIHGQDRSRETWVMWAVNIHECPLDKLEPDWEV